MKVDADELLESETAWDFAESRLRMASPGSLVIMTDIR
jgi:hypothetical protein